MPDDGQEISASNVRMSTRGRFSNKQALGDLQAEINEQGESQLDSILEQSPDVEQILNRDFNGLDLEMLSEHVLAISQERQDKPQNP